MASTRNVTIFNSDVTATVSDVTTSTSDVTTSTSDVTATISDVTASTSDVTATTIDVTTSSKNVSASRGDVTAYNSAISAANSVGTPYPARDYLSATRQLWFPLVNGPPTRQQGSGDEYSAIIQPPPILHLTVVYVEQFFGAGLENFGPEREFNPTMGVVWTSETKARLSRWIPDYAASGGFAPSGVIQKIASAPPYRAVTDNWLSCAEKIRGTQIRKGWADFASEEADQVSGFQLKSPRSAHKDLTGNVMQIGRNIFKIIFYKYCLLSPRRKMRNSPTFSTFRLVFLFLLGLWQYNKEYFLPIYSS